MFVVAAVALAMSCSHNVKQDYNTGDDGKIKQAKPVTFDDKTTQVKLHDIVTYPGGDRIDWRRIELPKDKVGTLSVTLKWKTPRPGLALGVDVFDQYGKHVVNEMGRHGSNEYVRKADIENATGSYLIRVYALERGDAGDYHLTLAFAENPADGPGFPPPATTIPDPPRLPAVVPPAVAVQCDASNYKTTKGCENSCPIYDKYWQGCANVCPPIPDVEIEACRPTMPCPVDDWDSRIKKCGKVAGPACPDGGPITTKCQVPPLKPVDSRVINANTKNGKTEARFGLKVGHKVEKGWKAHLVDDTGRTIADSECTISKIATKYAECYIGLTTDQVGDKKAVISPP
jgi:hypothetical protein